MVIFHSYVKLPEGNPCYVRPAFELALPTVQLLHKARIWLDEGPSLSDQKDPTHRKSWEHQRIILG